MERPVQLLSSIVLIVLINNCESKIPTINAAAIKLETRQGVTLADNKKLTAKIFWLDNSGDTIEVQSYRDGKEHGTWKKYYANQKLQELRYFNYGKKEGKYQVWWPDGKLKLEYNFSNNEYQGICSDWNEEGLLVKKKNYQRGYEEGLQQLWSNEGTLIANYEVRNGRNYGLTGIKGCATTWQANRVVAH